MARLLLGRLLVRQGDDRAAADALREATELFGAMQMTQQRERAQAVLSTIQPGGQ
jgi:hypothetical protein